VSLLERCLLLGLLDAEDEGSMMLHTSQDARLMQCHIPEAWHLPVTVHYSIAATVAEGPGHSYPFMIFEFLHHSGTAFFSDVMLCTHMTASAVEKPAALSKLEICKSTLTHLLTPCSKVLLEKLTGPQLVKKFPPFYGTRRFITLFTSARHLSLS
jgi:hypothetical protein